MLNIIENSDVAKFIDSIEDENIKKLINEMHFEYMQYMKVGTPEECKRYKEWCDLKPSDYMRLFDTATRALKDELECTERHYKNKIEEIELDKRKSNKKRTKSVRK